MWRITEYYTGIIYNHVWLFLIQMPAQPISLKNKTTQAFFKLQNLKSFRCKLSYTLNIFTFSLVFTSSNKHAILQHSCQLSCKIKVLSIFYRLLFLFDLLLSSIELRFLLDDLSVLVWSSCSRSLSATKVNVIMNDRSFKLLIFVEISRITRYISYKKLVNMKLTQVNL